MSEFMTTVTIAAPPERVWAVLTDVERWPEWTDTVERAEPVGDAPLGVGSEVHLVQPKLPPATWRITAWDPGRAFVWVSHHTGMTVTAEHVIESAPEGSRATLRVRLEGPLAPLMGRLAAAQTRRYLELEAAGLKARSEQPG